MTNRDDSLHQTLTRLALLDEALVAEVAPLDEGWFPAASLLDPDGDALPQALEHVAAQYPGADRRTVGSLFINDYSWHLPAVAIACYLAEQRVPWLAPDNLALCYRRYTWHEGGESGEAERLEVRFGSGRFAALPGDAAAGAPEVTVLPDLDALGMRLRAQIEAHMAPLIMRTREQTRLSASAQWAIVADSCAGTLLNIGRMLGQIERAQQEGLALVRAGGSPLYNERVGYVTLEAAGLCDTFRLRGGCCRYYTIGDNEKCTTCVLRPVAEREQRLRHYLVQKAESSKVTA